MGQRQRQRLRSAALIDYTRAAGTRAARGGVARSSIEPGELTIHKKSNEGEEGAWCSVFCTTICDVGVVCCVWEREGAMKGR